MEDVLFQHPFPEGKMAGKDLQVLNLVKAEHDKPGRFFPKLCEFRLDLSVALARHLTNSLHC
jgi:hypothetical protein